MVGVLARSPRAAAASRGGSARPAWLGVAFILMRGLFWGGGGCPDTELRLLADKVMGGAVRGSTSVRTYKYTNDSFSTFIELQLAPSYRGMLSYAAVRHCGCGKMSRSVHINKYDVNTVDALPRVMWSSSRPTSSSTSSTTSTSPCFSSSSPSSHLLQLLLVGSIRALACACGFGLWDTPRGAGFQARGGLAVFTRRGRGALLQTCRAPVSELFVCAQDCSPLPSPPPGGFPPPPLSPAYYKYLST